MDLNNKNIAVKDPRASMPLVDVNAETIRFLYRSVPTAVVTNIALAILTSWVLWQRAPHIDVIYWFSALMTLMMARAYGAYLFSQKSPSDEQVKKWKYAFLIKSTLGALVWGMSIWIFEPYTEPTTPILITFVLGGLTAGGAALLGAVRLIYFSYVLAMILPAIIWFFLQQSSMHSIMAIMLCIYIVAMFMGGYIYRNVLVNSIMLSNELVNAKEKAEAANLAKSRFLSSMSHELRTPLNAVLGFGQLLEMDAKDKFTKENAREIVNAGAHLLELINDVLDLSAIEAGKLQASITRIPIGDVLDGCYSLIIPLAAKRNIHLNKLPEDCAELTVLADVIRLKQVFLNFLSNAVKYNNDGGSISINCETNNKTLRIIISDTGMGLSDEQQQELFQEFSRAGAEHTSIQGTGIGLAISKRLVESMGGTVGVESKEGKGSSFWIELKYSAD